MSAFIYIFIVLLIINLLFLALSMVFTHFYGKTEPIVEAQRNNTRISVASSMLNRQLNPRLSVQPQVTLFELVRVSAGSSAYDAQMEGKRVSVQQGPKDL